MAAVAAPVPLRDERLPVLVQQRSRERAASRRDARWAQFILRLGFIATGIFAFEMALQTWQQGQIGTHREVVALVFADYAAAFAALTAALVPGERVRRAALLIPATLLLVLVAWFYVHIMISFPAYGTDNAVFSHVAAEQLIAGRNPYSINDPALIDASVKRFGLPSTFLTNTTDGRPLSELMSWPAGSVLVLVPPLYFGLHDVRWVVVAFEIAVLALLWWRASSVLRPLIVLPLAVDPDLFLRFTAGGVMDFIWVLPVMATAIALYRRRLGWAALLYGLSAGTKQQAWLLAPFLLVWLWHTSEDLSLRGRAQTIARFVAVSAAGFLALNAPFMLWDFRGWYDGVMLPFNAQLVPFGSGISLLTQTGLVDLPKSFYSVATFGVSGVLLLAYWLHFRTLKHAIWLAPAVIMWFGYRSLQNYYVYWAPVLLIGLIAWWEEEQGHDLLLHEVPRDA
ncbi:MAG: hypothetical protein KGK07_16410 [Chloroflexota bacterium]|nr:hypothetical protein [Chloroflexota bacterium]